MTQSQEDVAHVRDTPASSSAHPQTRHRSGSYIFRKENRPPLIESTDPDLSLLLPSPEEREQWPGPSPAEPRRRVTATIREPNDHVFSYQTRSHGRLLDVTLPLLFLPAAWTESHRAIEFGGETPFL